MSYTYIDKLIKQCKIAKKTKPEKIFFTDKKLNFEDTKTAIYIIRSIGGDVDHIFDDFKKFKSLNTRKCPAINNPSNILYIGSTTTSLKKRLNQHLGNVSKSTYALNLKYWFKYQIKIEVHTYNIEKEILQLIEDNLSYSLNPAFGKKGSNNK